MQTTTADVACALKVQLCLGLTITLEVFPTAVHILEKEEKKHPNNARRRGDGVGDVDMLCTGLSGATAEEPRIGHSRPLPI